jgi:uncharacterized protein YdcH (DUF465 family)
MEDRIWPMSAVDFLEHPVVWSKPLRDAGSGVTAPHAVTHPKTERPARSSSGAFAFPSLEIPKQRRSSAMFESQSREELDAILKTDVEFRQLYHRHRELDKQVLDAELGVLPLDDFTLAQMKREKLHAKDRLTQMFEIRQAH